MFFFVFKRVYLGSFSSAFFLSLSLFLRSWYSWPLNRGLLGSSDVFTFLRLDEGRDIVKEEDEDTTITTEDIERNCDVRESGRD